MSNKKFFITLNILNIILFTYLYVCMFTTFQLIDDMSNNISLLGAGIYIFFFVSKFFLLPFAYFIFNRHGNENIKINRFFEEFKSNENLQNKALLITFLYDLVPTIIFTIQRIFEESIFSIFSCIWIFLGYELFTMGGLCIFYVMLIIATKKKNL